MSANAGRTKALGLYRNLLKAHKRHLPKEMRELGDVYIRSEFKLHKTAKPEHLTSFFKEWGQYLDDILVTARTRESLAMGAIVDQSAAGAVEMKFGRDLPSEFEIKEEQRQQLENLRKEAEKLGRKSN